MRRRHTENERDETMRCGVCCCTSTAKQELDERLLFVVVAARICVTVLIDLSSSDFRDCRYEFLPRFCNWVTLDDRINVAR